VLGGCLYLAGKVARTRKPGFAAALAVALVLLWQTKENGFVYVPLVALPALLASRAGLPRVLGAFVLTSALLVGAVRYADGMAGGGGQGRKTTLPFSDMRALVLRGTLTPPLLSGDDLAIRPSEETLHAIVAPETPVSERFLLVLGLQVRRLVRFLGLWLLVVPLAVAAGVAMWRRGELERWQVVLGLGSTATIAMAVLVLVQARHAEVAILGTIWLLSLTLPTLWAGWDRTRRALAGALVVALGAQSVYLLGTLEKRRAQMVQFRAMESTVLVEWTLAKLPPGARLCSDFYWVGFVLEEPTRFCREDTYLYAAPPPDDAVYFLTKERSQLEFEGGDPFPEELLPVSKVAVGETWTLGRVEVVKVRSSAPATAGRTRTIWQDLGREPELSPPRKDEVVPSMELPAGTSAPEPGRTQQEAWNQQQPWNQQQQQPWNQQQQQWNQQQQQWNQQQQQWNQQQQQQQQWNQPQWQGSPGNPPEVPPWGPPPGTAQPAH
ncbi:MAG: hypothetical protein ACK4YP_18490, partial [Myxococcota bacterium]